MFNLSGLVGPVSIFFSARFTNDFFPAGSKQDLTDSILLALVAKLRHRLKEQNSFKLISTEWEDETIVDEQYEQTTNLSTAIQTVKHNSNGDLKVDKTPNKYIHSILYILIY